MKELVELIRSKLDDKKTYLVAIAAVVIAVLQATGVLPAELPPWVWKLLAGLGGSAGAGKAGIDRYRRDK